MASQDVFVGIDVSKDRLDVHVRPLGVGFSVSNEAAGYAALIARLRPLRVKRIVLEATGGYERAQRLALSEAGLDGADLVARASGLDPWGGQPAPHARSLLPLRGCRR